MKTHMALKTKEYFENIKNKLSRYFEHDKHYINELEKYSNTKNADLTLLKKVLRLRIKISFRSLLEMPHKEYKYKINYRNVVRRYNEFKIQYEKMMKDTLKEMNIEFKQSNNKVEKYDYDYFCKIFGKQYVNDHFIIETKIIEKEHKLENNIKKSPNKFKYDSGFSPQQGITDINEYDKNENKY